MPDASPEAGTGVITEGSSSQGQTEAIAGSEQQPSIEDLRKQLEASKRQAQTYEGNARSLREKEQALQSTIDQQSRQIREVMDQLEKMQEAQKSSQINATLQQLRDQGVSEQEIRLARALVDEQARLEKEAKKLAEREAQLKPAALDLEIRQYIDNSIARANTKLANKGFSNLITDRELKEALGSKTIKEQQDVEDVVQDLILKRTDERLNESRSDKLQQRAADGKDPSPKGSATIDGIRAAELALRNGTMKQKEFMKYAIEAAKQGVRGYR